MHDDAHPEACLDQYVVGFIYWEIYFTVHYKSRNILFFIRMTKRPTSNPQTLPANSDLCTGVRRFVPDEYVFGALDYLFAVGVWGFRILGLGQVLGTNSHDYFAPKNTNLSFNLHFAFIRP